MVHVLGQVQPPIIRPKAHRLKTVDPRCTSVYNQILSKGLVDARIPSKWNMVQILYSQGRLDEANSLVEAIDCTIVTSRSPLNASVVNCGWGLTSGALTTIRSLLRLPCGDVWFAQNKARDQTCGRFSEKEKGQELASLYEM